MRSAKKYLIPSVFIVSLFLPFYAVFACTTPVFKYAMEMWAQDHYTGLVIYDGSLTPEEEKTLEKLQGAISRDVSLNLSLQKIDIDSDRRTLKKLLGKNIPEHLPALVLWYPMQMGYAPPIWTGSLSGQVMEQIIQSPVRREIGDHLLRGVPVVWALIQSGDHEKDQYAIKVLEQELQTAKKDILDDPLFQPHFEHIINKSDLFPVVLISGKENTVENLLLATFLNFYSVPEEIGEPVVFPIFGRGRALGMLAGNEIDANTIQDVIAFLLNPCSCQIKMANPGFDLLLRSDWNTLLARFDQVTLRPVMAGVMPDTTGQYDYLDVIDLTGGESKFFSSRILSTTGIIIGATIVFVILASIIIIRCR